MNRLLLVPALLVLFSCASATAAQVRFELQAGASLPFGEYAADDSQEAGFASPGVSVLAHVSGVIESQPGLEWIASIGVVSHGVQQGFEDVMRALGATSVSVGRYLEIPVLAGLRYRVPLGVGPSLHFDAQGGVFYVKGPDFELDGADVTFEGALKPGLAFGAGLDVTDRFGLGARLVPLGTVKADVGIPDQPLLRSEQRVSYVDVYLAVGL